MAPYMVHAERRLLDQTQPRSTAEFKLCYARHQFTGILFLSQEASPFRVQRLAKIKKALTEALHSSNFGFEILALRYEERHLSERGQINSSGAAWSWGSAMH